MFLVLELMSCFVGSLAINYVPINNQQCVVMSTLINLNLYELHYYPFIVSMNMCDGTCNDVEDPFDRKYVPNKIKYVNLKVFDMIKEITESKTPAKYISRECKYGFDGKKCSSRQKWKNGKCPCDCKKPKRYSASEDYYV